MLRLARSFPRSPTAWRYAVVRVEARTSAASTQTEKTESGSSPPPPPRSGGIFWKLLGLTVVGAGGVVGYAWYDPEFKKLIEQNVPYSKDALKYVFDYLPPSPQEPTVTPAVDTKLPSTSISTKDKPTVASKTTVSTVSQTATQDAAGKLSPVRTETDRERSAREAREKKEKAQESLRKREAEEAAENVALETGLESLLGNVKKSLEAAITSQQVATQAVKAHTDQLKKAMDSGSTENQWEALTDSQQARTDAVWASEQTRLTAQESLEKLRRAVADGRANKTTKRNKVLSLAEKQLNTFDYELSSAVAELSKARSEVTVLTNYRDLVRKGKRQFTEELEEMVPDVKLGDGSSSRLTTAELNSLIAHAHRRVDQLQRQLVEQLAMEPLRADSALDNQRSEDERLTDEQIERERQKVNAELNVLKEVWEAEARVEFESELRRQLARQAAAHSDHLVDVLRAQRQQLNIEFETQLVDSVNTERKRLGDEIHNTVSRMHAIEAAVEGRAQKQRCGRNARELWLACKTLLSVVKDGSGVVAANRDEPVPVSAQLKAVLEAGAEFPIVHVALSAVPETATSRGVYSSDTLAKRFKRVRRVARRVALVDDSNATLGRYMLSYVQSWFVLRSWPARDTDDVSTLSPFALLDNAQRSLERGDLEQAVRYINQLGGEARRVVADWLAEARILLETRQSAELLMAFASANGLDSLD